jgi:hypothetical protein
VWIAAAGSEKGLGAARSEFAKALRNPKRALGRQGRGAPQARAPDAALAAGRPPAAEGDRLGQAEPRRPHAACLGPADPLDQPGQAVPRPAGHREERALFGAGFPDYPWLFATDGEYTAFAASRSASSTDRGPPARAARRLRDRSTATRQGRPRGRHDGSVYFGANADAGQHRRDGQVPERRRADLALDRRQRFRDEMYDFASANLHSLATLDADGDGWPEGLGNVERPGMGEEKLDNTVYTIRGLRDLADMARASGDRATERWARGHARRSRAPLRGRVVGSRASRATPTRSTIPATTRSTSATGSA